MKLGALIVGILGAITALIGSLLAGVTAFTGAVVTNIDASLGGDSEVVESVSAGPMAFGIIASIVGLVGAAIVMRKRKAAIVLLLISIIVGLIATGWFYALGAILLLIAALLAFLGGKEYENTTNAVMKCSACGKDSPENAEFCVKCGAQFSAVSN